MERDEASAWTRFLKQFWLILAYVIALLLVAIFLRSSRTDPAVGNWILAYSTITLVAVTVYYAIQTHQLVEQERRNIEEEIKKRNVEFLERRINEFYAPFIEAFNSAWEKLHTHGVELQTLLQIRLDAQRILWGKGYLISNETYQKIDKWLGTSFLVAFGRREHPSYEEHKKATENLRERINGEWADIENSIREFYGVPFDKNLRLHR